MTAALSLKTKGPASAATDPDLGSTIPTKGKTMNAHSDTTAPAAPATLEELAALDFAPWQHSPDQWSPPTDEQWVDLANPNLITVRVGWLVLHKSKAELITMLDEIDDDLGDDMFERLQHTSDFFRGLLAITEGALGRLCSAGASLELARGAAK